MPKKPEIESRDPRLIAKGTVIWHKGLGREEVVRDVSVVLHMANGEDLVYRVGSDEIEVIAEQPSAPKARDLPKPRTIPDPEDETVEE